MTFICIKKEVITNKESVKTTQKRKPAYVLILFVLFVATSCEFAGTTTETTTISEEQSTITSLTNISLPLPTKLYSGYIEDSEMGSSFSHYHGFYEAITKNIQYNQTSEMYQGEDVKGIQLLSILLDKDVLIIGYQNSDIEQGIIADIVSKKFVNIPTTEHTILQIVLENIKYSRTLKETEKEEIYDFKGSQIRYFFIHNDKFYYIGTHEDIADGNYLPMYRYILNENVNDYYDYDADEDGHYYGTDEYLYDHDAYQNWYDYDAEEILREYDLY